MHTYSTDSSEREQILLGLALLAVLLAWGLSRLLHFTQLTVPWWFDAPSTMSFYGILFKLFDRRVWQCRMLRWIGLLKVPVLTGEWRGHVVSSFDGHKKPHEVRIRITQTWTRIAILLSSDTSSSHTLTAAIQVRAPEGVVLSYQYENQPRPGAVKTMEIHLGTARLVFSDDRVLEGYYYSGRGRQEYGSIHLERVQSKSNHTYRFRGRPTNPTIRITSRIIILQVFSNQSKNL